MEWFFFHAASLGLTALLGGMVAFAILFAPLVFTQLPADIAGGFIRKVFPFYYLYVLVLGLLTGLFMALSNHGFLGFVVAVVGLVCAYTRWFLMPEINRLRDADLAGDEAAGRAFSSQHRLSVIINSVQMLLLLVVLFVWAQPWGLSVAKAVAQ